MFSHLRHIRVFQAVAEAGNMKKASLRLGRAQSAVSRSIEELEQLLGVDLFERHARGVLPTEAGKVLLRRVNTAFAELRAGRQALTAAGDDKRDRLAHAPVFTLAVGRRQIDVLTALAVPNHLGGVAKQLQVSQPAVSMAVRDLELSTGLVLFERSTGGTRLTPAGEILLFALKRAMTQLRLAVAEISELKGLVQGDVTVGALPFSRAYILPAAIARVTRDYPRIRVMTVEAPLAVLTSDLKCGDIDFVVGALQSDHVGEELVREDMFSDRMAIIARRGHPGAAAKDCRALLATASWILPHRRAPTRAVASEGLKAIGIEFPHIAVESSDLSIIRGLLLESDMLTVASRHLFHHEIESGALISLPLVLPETSRSVGILRRMQDHISPGAELLIREIRAIAAGSAGLDLAPRRQAAG